MQLSIASFVALTSGIMKACQQRRQLVEILQACELLRPAVELVRCRALLGMKVVALADGVRTSSALELEEVKLVSSSDSPRCPQCGQLVLTAHAD